MSDIFSRWSRRKLAGTPATAQPAGDGTVPAEAPAGTVPDEELDEAQYLKDHGLPDPDTMVRGDDFTQFMKSGVPRLLRRRALRRLWTSNPVLACVDGLNDYDEDYRATGGPSVVRTAYRVGRGFLADPDPVPHHQTAGIPPVEPGSADTALSDPVAVDPQAPRTVEPVGVTAPVGTDGERIAERTLDARPTDRVEPAAAVDAAARRPRRMAFCVARSAPDKLPPQV